MTFTKHSTSIPYSDPPSRLQTLDIWLPKSPKEADTDNSLWIMYISPSLILEYALPSRGINPSLTNSPATSTAARGATHYKPPRALIPPSRTSPPSPQSQASHPSITASRLTRHILQIPLHQTMRKELSRTPRTSKTLLPASHTCAKSME
jgi:hypothetical protein